MKGHTSAVTHIIVNSDKGEIISAAQDKVIKLIASLISVQQSFLKSELKYISPY